MEINNININEEYFNDIHNMKPKWWMRWGILSVFFVLIIIILLGSFIRYPDVIKSEFRLTTNAPSITIPLVRLMEIEKIFIKNNQLVEPGAHILVIKNNNNYKDVLFLENELKSFSFEKDSLINFFDQFLNKDLYFGDEIEANWVTLSNELLEYYKIEKLDSHQSQIKFLQDELSNQINLKNFHKELINHDKEQKKLLDEKLNTNSRLFDKGVISKSEYNTQKSNYLKQEEALEHNVLALKRVNIDIVKIQNTIKNYSNSEEGLLLEKQLTIRKSLNKLRSSIQLWKKKFLVTSPIHGVTTFIQDLKENSFHEGNIVVITPEKKSFYATINIPFIGAGKVEKGQKVNLKLNDYPFREYGFLEGNLVEFSPVAGKDFYLGRVEIKSITSNHRKKIKAKENMAGIGEIITNDRSLLGRIFEEITYVFIQ